jgi:hypothetical protein
MSTGIFLTNGQWRTYPQGYMYQADVYCPDHILGILLGVADDKHTAETVIEEVAKARGIDYSDEYSYDTDDFPKAITDTDEELRCAVCNTDLREV